MSLDERAFAAAMQALDWLSPNLIRDSRLYLLGAEDVCSTYMGQRALAAYKAAELLGRERIISAALRVRLQCPGVPNGEQIISAPPPARHHTLLHPTNHTLPSDRRVQPEDQGFLTSTGRFVGREEALQIAIASGQPMIDHPSRHATQLFSEDLW